MVMTDFVYAESMTATVLVEAAAPGIGPANAANTATQIVLIRTDFNGASFSSELSFPQTDSFRLHPGGCQGSWLWWLGVQVGASSPGNPTPQQEGHGASVRQPRRKDAA